MGFPAESLDSVCITFDKLDKIHIDGVRDELTAKNMPAKAIDNLVEFCMNLPASLRDDNVQEHHFTLDDVRPYCSDTKIIDELEDIITAVKKIANNRYRIDYCPTLVRGQGYYTGVVFEIQCTGLDLDIAIGGGGRYDNLIGKFTNESIPAVGFSIGFERLCLLLSGKTPNSKTQKGKYALVYEEGADFANVMAKAKELREKYDIVTIFKKAKKPGPQYAMLEKEKYTNFGKINKDGVFSEQ
jgi:histidyl-tRNA synthetase